MRKIDSELKQRLKNLISSMGYELVGGEWVQAGGQRTLRIYIDSLPGELASKVTVDGCSKVSHQVSGLLDVDEDFQGRYTLEVSSPGIDRPLFELEDYKKYLGQEIRMRLQAPIDNRRQYKGVLLKVEAETIYLKDESLEQEVMVPFSAVERANLIGKIPGAVGKGKVKR